MEMSSKPHIVLSIQTRSPKYTVHLQNPDWLKPHKHVCIHINRMCPLLQDYSGDIRVHLKLCPSFKLDISYMAACG